LHQGHVFAVRRLAFLSRQDDDLRVTAGIVGERVGGRPAHDRDVPGQQPLHVALVRHEPGDAARERDEAERRFVLYSHRPGRLEQRPEQEGSAGAWSVQQAGDRIHVPDSRRTHMQSSFSAMDSLSQGKFTRRDTEESKE